jgi:hypothetical protein
MTAYEIANTDKLRRTQLRGISPCGIGIRVNLDMQASPRKTGGYNMSIQNKRNVAKVVVTIAALLCAAATAQATEFDIVGMKLGMNADQVLARYKELRPEGKHRFIKWSRPGGTEWVANGATLYSDLSKPDDMEQERMSFVFTGVGSGNKLFSVQRQLQFRPSERPSTEAVYAVAVKKYGEPSYVNKSETNINASWKFDAIDSPAKKIDGPRACVNTSTVGLDDYTAKKAKETAADFCGLYIEFSVDGDQTGIAKEIMMGMVNYLDLTRDYEADIRDAQERLDAAKMENTNKAAPAPQL